MRHSRGYTLVELIVAVGLFASVMTIATGAYLIMIRANREAQVVATGINNLSYALESMSRTIRTGTAYNCSAVTPAVNCDYPVGGTTFSVTNQNNTTTTYTFTPGGVITENNAPLTDSSVTVTSLRFYVTGVAIWRNGRDLNQPHVTIVVAGTVEAGPGKTETFNVETGATMRGSDI